MSNYKVNPTNKTIIIDMKNVTTQEMELIKLYVGAGYILKEKKEGITYADMKKGLKGNPDALKELENKIKEKENYMLIKKWYGEQLRKA